MALKMKRVLDKASDVLNKLRKKDTKYIFAEPVPKEIPSYYEVIERPMDFQTLERLLKNGAYDTIEQFKDDVDVIFSNCTYFNQRDTIYYKEAIRMQKCADKLLSKAAADLRKLDTPARSRGKTKTKKSSEKTKRPGKKQSKKTSAKSGKTISVSGSKGKASAAYAVSASVSSASTSTSTSTSSSASSSSSSLSSSFTSSVGVSSGANSVPFLVCADGLDLSTAAKKRKYVKGGVIKKTRDVRQLMGPGNLNDFNLHLPPTIMDLALIWEREQELRLQTGKSVGQRKEQHLAKCEAIGPLYFRSADRSNTSSSASTLGPASTSASYAELYCQRMERYFLGFPQSAQLLFKQKLAFLTDAALKSEGELSAGGSGDEKMDSICKNGCRDETNMSSVGSHNQNDDHGGSPGDNSFAGADAAKNGNVSTNMNVDNCNENSTSDGEHKESKNAGAEDKNGELAMDSDNKYIVQQNGNYTVSSHVLSLLLNSTLPTTSAGTASTNAAVESVGEIIEYLRSHRTSYQRAPSKVEVATVQKAPGCSSAMSECALKKKEGLNYPDADAITASQARQLLEHTKKKQKVSNSDKSDNIGSHCSYSDVESDVQFQNELISLLARFPASA